MKLNSKDVQDMMVLAQLHANEISSDSERKVGVYMHTTTDNIIAANTFVDGAENLGLPRNAPNKYEYMIHAEVNALLEAAAKGVSTYDAIVVTTLSPCPNCVRSMFQAGIREVYWRDRHSSYKTDLKDIKITETPYGEYIHMKLENY
jgi:deoxycytidylate deaminase